MSYYILAVGGTGNKILESTVYAACADCFTVYGSDDILPTLHMLSIDVDSACGNTTRAKQAAISYGKVQQAMADGVYRHPCFHTAVDLEQWSIDLSKRAASIQKMSQNHSTDEALAHLLFTESEAALEYNEGFRGHPDLGVLFFSDILQNMEQMQNQNQKDEFSNILLQIEEELKREEDVHVLLCGSIFGGTGASGIPAIAKYLQRRFRQQRKHFIMGASLLLPYYKVPKTQKENELEITVESDAFLDKARTALQYYGMERMIRDGSDDEAGLFDALYLLGLPPEQFVETKSYSTGSSSQENDAHLMEWIATRCIAHFMGHSFRDDQQGLIDCYYYQINQKTMNWHFFDSDADKYRLHYGALLKSALAYCTECYATLQDLTRNQSKKAKRVNYCAANFYMVQSMNTKERVELDETLQALYTFYSFFVNWFAQIMDNLPPVLHSEVNGNQMVNEDALFQLREYLSEVGTASNNNAQTDSLAENLQRKFSALLYGSVQDTTSWSDLIIRLGQNERRIDSHRCFPHFLTGLITKVIEWH